MWYCLQEYGSLLASNFLASHWIFTPIFTPMHSTALIGMSFSPQFIFLGAFLTSFVLILRCKMWCLSLRLIFSLKFAMCCIKKLEEILHLSAIIIFLKWFKSLASSLVLDSLSILYVYHFSLLYSKPRIQVIKHFFLSLLLLYYHVC